MVVAVAGLLVSLVALWPRADGSQTVRAANPGPSALPAPGPSSAGDPAQRGGTESPEPGRVARRDASLTSGSASSTGSGPVRVALPSIGVTASTRAVGVAGDGQMQLPADPRVLGWYRFGPAPGEGRGSVVLAGHLDSRRFGLGPLVRLRDVTVGDEVRIEQADGSTRVYLVSNVTRYDRQALPAALFARTGPERLRLITCGGAYDAEVGGYQENLVVTATPRR